MKNYFFTNVLPIYEKLHAYKYLNSLKTGKISLNILVIANWIVWACAWDSNSSLIPFAW